MGGFLLSFFVVLFLLAALFRADFVLVILYILAGAFFFSHWWSRKAIRAVTITRTLAHRAFFGEKLSVRVSIRNKAVLPLVWIYLRETLPMELAAEGETQRVAYIGPKETITFDYSLDCRKRGYYSIGPLTMFSGDLLGLTRQSSFSSSIDPIIVYPKIIPLTRIEVPTHSPLGTLRHNQPLFEDPSRVRGKRNYIPGDSLRRIDWKATAVSRHIQVKLFEPSIALETMVFLNLNREEYDLRESYRASELGIVASASMIGWVIQKRQRAGFATNGKDPLMSDQNRIVVRPNRGRGQFIYLLEILARIQCENTSSFVQLLHEEILHLSWGVSIVVITNQAADELFDVLFNAHRRGLKSTLVVCGQVGNFLALQHKAADFSVPFFHLLSEKDLKIWQG